MMPAWKTGGRTLKTESCAALRTKVTEASLLLIEGPIEYWVLEDGTTLALDVRQAGYARGPRTRGGPP